MRCDIWPTMEVPSLSLILIFAPLHGLFCFLLPSHAYARAVLPMCHEKNEQLGGIRRTKQCCTLMASSLPYMHWSLLWSNFHHWFKVWRCWTCVLSSSIYSLSLSHTHTHTNVCVLFFAPLFPPFTLFPLLSLPFPCQLIPRLWLRKPIQH